MFVSLAVLLTNCFVPYMDYGGATDNYQLQNINNVVQFNDSPSEIDSREDYYCNYDFNFVDDESLLTPQTYNLFSLSISYTANSSSTNTINATFNRNSTELFNYWLYIELYVESDNHYTEQVEWRDDNRFTLYENRNDTSNCVIPVDSTTGYIWDITVHIVFHLIDSYTFDTLEAYITNPNNAYGNGYNQGFSDGQNYGYEEGKVDGYSEGHDVGYGKGLDVGYDNGYAVGIASGSPSLVNLFASIADTPIIMLHGMFNFEIFGVNVLTLVLSLLTALMLLFVVKKLWK